MSGVPLDALLPSLALDVGVAAVLVTAACARLRATSAHAGELALLLFALSAAAAARSAGLDPAWSLEGHLAFDAWANVFHLALSLGAVSVCWLSLRHREEDALPAWSWSALAASLLGLQALASATGVVSAWAGFELAGLGTAAWVAAHRGARTVAASMLLRGALASALLLLGLGLLAGLSGATDWAAMSSRLAIVPSMPGGRAAMFTGVMLAAAAFASRAALAPWLLWPAGETAALPLSSTLWIVVGGSMGGLAALGRFLGSAVCATGENGAWSSPGGLEWASVLGVAGIVTVVAANAALLREYDLRRLFAWLAVSQAGCIAVGLAEASASGLGLALLHAIMSALTLTGLVAALECLSPVAHVAGVAEVSGAADVSGEGRIDAIRGLLRRPLRHRLPGIAFAAFLLSWAGVWPMAGRVARTAMLSAAMEAGRWVTVAGLMAATVLGWMVAVRIVAILLDRGNDRDGQRQAGEAATPRGIGDPADPDALLLAALLLVAVLGLGLAPEGLAGLAARSVAFFGG